MAHIADKVADDLVARQIQILRASEGMIGKLYGELEAADNKIQALLRKTDLTQFSRQRLISSLNQIRRIASDFAGAAYPQMQNELSKIATMISGRTAKDLNDIFNIDVFNPTLNANQLTRLVDQTAILGGQTLGDFWGRQPNSIVDSYSKVLRTGIVTGASKAEMLKELADTGLTATRAQLKTFVRSSVMEVANGARMEMYKQNGDLINGIYWLSTLDSRTSSICRGLDGLKWDLNYNPIGHGTPYPGSTAHPNCRSTQLPLIKSFAELAGKNKDLAAKLDEAMSGGTRASMDGQVPSNLTYNDWLKTKGSAFAKDLLGPTRFAMWENGDLSMRDMLSQSGRPLTIPELQGAFDKTAHGMQQFADDWKDVTNLQKLSTNFNKKLRDWAKTYDDPGGKSALTNYSNRGFVDINKTLRTGLPNDPARYMQELYDKVPASTDEMRLFRGVTVDHNHKFGDVFTDKGFFSTTATPGVATEFANAGGQAQIVYDIRMPKGSKMLPGLYSRIQEQEMILAPGTKFRVLGKVEKEFPYWDANKWVQKKFITYEIEPIMEAVAAVPKVAPIVLTPRELEIASQAYFKEAVATFRASGEALQRPILDYIASSGPINAHLREGLFSDLAPTVASMRANLATYPLNTQELRLWRGADSTGMSLVTGDLNEVSGFFSTSTSRGIGANFWLSNYNEVDNAILFDIKVPKGTARMLPGSGSEMELIMDHGTRFRVTGSYYDTLVFDGHDYEVLIVEVEIVP